MKKALQFKCPDCGEMYIEEVRNFCTIIQHISSLIFDDSNCESYIEYGDMTLEDEDINQISCYRCFACGYVLKDNYKRPITGKEDLCTWIKEQDSDEEIKEITITVNNINYEIVSTPKPGTTTLEWNLKGDKHKFVTMEQLVEQIKVVRNGMVQ